MSHYISVMGNTAGRRKAVQRPELFVKMKNIAKAAMFRHFLDFVTAALQHKFRVFYSDLINVPMNHHAGFMLEDRAKIIRGHLQRLV
jgi:hypothetical protein